MLLKQRKEKKLDFTFLSKISLFHGMEETEIEDIMHCFDGYTRKYSKGETIYHMGEIVTKIGIVLSGNVHIEKDDVWGKWHRVCTTSVADVPQTVIYVSTLSSDEAKDGDIIYTVKNGICHMTITNLKLKNTDQILKMFPDNTIPKCAIRERWYVLTDTTDATNNMLVNIRQDGSMGHYKLGNIDKVYSGSFSYPVAES